MNLSSAAPLLLWIGSSLSAGLVARALAVRLPALGHAGLGRWAAELALLLYYVGWPSLALFNGVLSADLMGLGRIGVMDTGLVLGFALRDWLWQATTAGLAAGFVLAVAWLAGRSATEHAPDDGQAPAPSGLVWRNAVYAEVHWAFYRAPFLLLLSDVYWGALAGLALILAEWRWLGWPLSGRHPVGQFVHLACALVSTLLCISASNLWLAIVAQFVIRRYGAQLVVGSRAVLRSR
jgi:hypothetical protein